MLIVLLVLSLANVSMGYNNGIGRKPPMGWNSWCTGDGVTKPSLCNLFGKDPCSESEVRFFIGFHTDHAHSRNARTTGQGNF